MSHPQPHIIVAQKGIDVSHTGLVGPFGQSSGWPMPMPWPISWKSIVVNRADPSCGDNLWSKREGQSVEFSRWMTTPAPGAPFIHAPHTPGPVAEMTMAFGVRHSL